MRPDIPYSKNPKTGEIGFGNKLYPSMAALELVIARRERMAGEQLTAQQLINGLHVDTRTPSEQIRDSHWLPVPVAPPKPPERNIFRSSQVEELINREQEKRGAPVDRRALYSAAAEAEDARLAAADAKAAFDADPERIKVRQAAEQALELAMFSKDSTPELLIEAKRLKVQADHDLQTAKKMYVQFMDQLEARANERRRQLESEVAALFEREGFDSAPTPKRGEPEFRDPEDGIFDGRPWPFAHRADEKVRARHIAENEAWLRQQQ